MPTFLCYDLKGIQSFIFAVPRLRYVIGGSAIVDQFDRRVAPELGGDAHVFSAGGRGTFSCQSQEEAERLRDELVSRAHEVGLDIAFGIDVDFARASNEAREVHPFVPLDLTGEPCVASGLYPVAVGKGAGYREDRRGVHPVVWRRVQLQGDRGLEARVFGAAIRLPPPLAGHTLRFFSSVDATDDDDDAVADGRAGAAAIGGRNRWAVVAMDGNDMGSQFRTFFQTKPSTEATVDWIRRVSHAMDRCTLAACVSGIEAVLAAWVDSPGFDRAAIEVRGELVLPIRPLVVGGDDIVVLVHPAFALDFVRAATRRFQQASAEAHTREQPLWVATNGAISISAGVLWTPVTMPLATAISYAESLLASAKWHGRQRRAPGSAAPACIDWESVTEGLLDTPAARRQRELRFHDGDLGQDVVLTRRPYTVEDLREVEELADQYARERVPRSLCHSLLPSLRAAFDDRLTFAARIAKRHAFIADHLRETAEGGSRRSRWRVDRRPNGSVERSTDLLDAMLILQESRRIS